MGRLQRRVRSSRRLARDRGAADLRPVDLEPVVAAYQDFLGKFRCAICGSWPYVTPKRGRSEDLRFDCPAFNFNLESKQR